MSDIHVPTLEAHGSGHSIFKILLEVVLIGVGVFLGLAGEQWRENGRHREMAERTLRRFRAEIVKPQRRCRGEGLPCLARGRFEEILHYRSRQTETPTTLTSRKASAPLICHTRRGIWRWRTSRWPTSNRISALHYPTIEHTGTARRRPRAFRRRCTSIHPANIPRGFSIRSAVTNGDANLIEPQLVKAFDAILPRIDNALGDAPNK